MTKPSPHHLPQLDRAAITAEARAHVTAQLDGISEPAERARIAADIVNAADAVIESQRPKRDALALSLSLHDGARAVNQVIGVNRTRWYEVTNVALGITAAEAAAKWRLKGDDEDPEAYRARIADRAAARGVKHYPTAARRLPELALAVAQAEERARAARPIRDAAVGELLAAGWTRPQIAGVIGRNPSRVSHIKRAAAVA